MATSVIAWMMYRAILLNHQMDDVIREAEEIYELEEVQVFLLEERLAMQDYRLTGEARYLTRYIQFEEIADLALRKALINAASPGERDNVKQLSDEKEAYNRTFDRVIELHESGDLTGALDWTGWVTCKLVTNPVQVLTDAARSLSDGQFDPRVLVDLSKRSDEIGKLAQAFIMMSNQSGRRLTDLRLEAEELRAKLERVAG